MKKKESDRKVLNLAEIIQRIQSARQTMGEVAWTEYLADERRRNEEALLQSTKRVEDFWKSDEFKAREKLRLSLEEISQDPLIRQSETCMEVVEAFRHCVTYFWGASDSEAMLQPIGDEFGRLTRKRATVASHERTNAAREWIWSEWIAYRNDYDDNKTAFSRDYVKRLKNEHGVTITDRQMREVWLKTAPVASRP